MRAVSGGAVGGVAGRVRVPAGIGDGHPASRVIDVGSAPRRLQRALVELDAPFVGGHVGLAVFGALAGGGVDIQRRFQQQAALVLGGQVGVVAVAVVAV